MFHHIGCILGGAFLANAIPHLVNGISGRPFQTPFARPPGKGLSSARVNILWSAFNLLAGSLFLRWCDFDITVGWDFIALSIGALVMALISAKLFGKLHGGDI